jgi:hypothetical protein
MTAVCSMPGGSCEIPAGGCDPGCYNIDGEYADGCECCDDDQPKSCGAVSSSLGTLGVGASGVTAQGSLPGAGESDWFVVTFTGNTTWTGTQSSSYHPEIELTSNDANIKFDLYVSCGGASLTCTEGNCVGKTVWEEYYAGGAPTGNGGGGTTPWGPISPVGNNGQVYIRVYRPTGNPTCDTFMLTISN